MARTATLAVLRSSVKSRGSYENSADITSAMLTEFINEAVAECYDLLVQRWADYYVTRTTLVTVAGTDTVALPATFYKLRKLEIVDASVSSGYRQLRPADLAASHMFGTVTDKNYRYRIEGASIVLMPTPNAVETLRMFHIPWATVLSADGDTFDGINGYEELVVQLALLRCKSREELGTAEIEREIDRLKLRIRDAADGRDATEPMYYRPTGPDDEGDWGGWDW